MFQLSPVILAHVLSFAGRSLAQFPPPVTYDTVLKSPINPNVTVSYKEPDPGTCATAFASQKQYSGYVTLPPFTLEPYQQNYSINTFFWFFEARNNSSSAPLTIWLNGGPGSSSMIGLFREMGPCEVVQLANGSFSTKPNVWGWDRSSNLLFIDQPTQVGFSYDYPVNVSVDIQHSGDIYPPSPLPPHTPAWGFLNGTLPSGTLNHTQNSTIIAASAAWHFLQSFLSAFPQYNPGRRLNKKSTEPTGVNLFTESYGGQYGPTFADYFEDQNERRRTGEIAANATLEVKLATLGIINGMVDTLIQTPAAASFAYNNTYGLQTIDQTSWLNLLSSFVSYCHPQINLCRQQLQTSYPGSEGEGFDSSTSAVCSHAADLCVGLISQAIDESQRSPYDIRVKPPSSFPSYAYLEYLNNADVQRSIGARVNYTESNEIVYRAFGQTGDVVRGTQLQKLADLMARGIRVAFVYGDADIICNWVGGESVSLELARLTSYKDTFPAAGYADVVANASYVGGQVRQYGNLSFTRVYDAGHTIPAYQPETAFVIFSRIIQGNDIGMGHDVDLASFGTQGPAHSIRKNKVPPQPDDVCWIRAISDTCSDDEQRAISIGAGVVKNGMWLPEAVAMPSPSTHVRDAKPIASEEASTTTTYIAADLTGVYTATATPLRRLTSGASSVHFRPRFGYVVDDIGGIGGSSSKVPLIAGLVGGLVGSLLLTIAIATCIILRRRHRRPDPEPEKTPPSPTSTDEPLVRLVDSAEPRRKSSIGGIEESPKEPVAPTELHGEHSPRPLEAAPEGPVVPTKPRRKAFLDRLRYPMRTPADPSVPRDIDIERAEQPPPFESPIPSRRTSVPMDPIPEVHTPRPSMDTRKPDVAPVEEGQRSAKPDRDPGDPMFLAEEPIWAK